MLTAYLMILLDLSIVYTGMPEIGKTMNMSPVAQTWVQKRLPALFRRLPSVFCSAGRHFRSWANPSVWCRAVYARVLVIGISQSPYELIAARAVQEFAHRSLRRACWPSSRSPFPKAASGRGRWRGILMGAITSTLGVGLLVYGLVNAAEAGWLDLITLITLVLSVAVLGLFLWHEGRVDVPVLPLRILRSRERSAAYVARMLYVGSIVSFFFFGTQLMQRVLGYSAFQAGLGFPAHDAGSVRRRDGHPPYHPNGGWRSDADGGRCCSSASGFSGWQMRAPARHSGQLAMPTVVIGIGNGAAMAPLTTSGVRGVEGRDQGAASGVVNVAHQLGGSIGLSVLILVFAANANPRLTGAMEMSHQVSAVFIGAAVMNLLAGSDRDLHSTGQSQERKSERRSSPCCLDRMTKGQIMGIGMATAAACRRRRRAPISYCPSPG